MNIPITQRINPIIFLVGSFIQQLFTMVANGPPAATGLDLPGRPLVTEFS